ncbi:MAG: hypothetical protein Tsb0014_33460 [Pleurocapsa sp.]
MIKILIVDDQKTVQEVLKSYIQEDPNLEVIDCASNGQQALELVEIHRPNIILMDIEMPILDGLSATKIISEQFVDSHVLILTVHNNDTYLNSALQVGAKGYLLKNTPAKELINAIYSAYKGYFQLGPGLLEKYLYKVSLSQDNYQEIEQLKSLMVNQSKLLENMTKNPSTRSSMFQSKNDRNELQDKYASLEQKLHFTNYRLDKLDKKLAFIEQFGYFIVVSFIVMILIVGIVSIE